MVFRCKKCFRPIKGILEHGYRGDKCKEAPLRRCLNCNALEDHNKGRQAICASSRAAHGIHVFEKEGK